jgi:hypothetical protein
VRLAQFAAVAALTALETIRQPICLLLTAACVLLTALGPLVRLHQFGEPGKLARDGGLAFHLVFGLLIAAYAAGSTLSREMQRGTAAAVLSKPVSRPVFFLAKFAGVAAVILAFSFCAGLATLLSERVSEKLVGGDSGPGYVTDWQTGFLLLAAPAAAFLCAGALNLCCRRPFESTAFGCLVAALALVLLIACAFDRTGVWAPFRPSLAWRLVPASLLVTLALLVLGALTISLCTRLSAVPTLFLCGLIFCAGLLADYAFGRHSDRSLAAAVLYRLIPNWQHFWAADALDHGGSIPLGYLGRAALYALGSAAGLLTLGTLSFGSADVK